MERALVCLPSLLFPEQVCEHWDQGVQGLRAQSLGQGTSQMTGIGRMASRHSCLATYSPAETTAHQESLTGPLGSGSVTKVDSARTCLAKYIYKIHRLDKLWHKMAINLEQDPYYTMAVLHTRTNIISMSSLQPWTSVGKRFGGSVTLFFWHQWKSFAMQTF